MLSRDEIDKLDKERNSLLIQVEELDKYAEINIPELAELKIQRAGLNAQLTDATVRVKVTGKADGSVVDRLKDEISELDADIEEKTRILSGITDAKDNTRRQIQLIELQLAVAEYEALVPEVNRRADEYLQLRKAIGICVADYRDKNNKITILERRIQGLRKEFYLSDDINDLPKHKSLAWNRPSVIISEGMLQGDKIWQN